MTSINLESGFTKQDTFALSTKNRKQESIVNNNTYNTRESKSQ